jgi:hypothetical protein
MFIYRKEYALHSDICREILKKFDESDEKKPGVLYGPNGIDSNGGKKSLDITFNPSYLQHPTWGGLLKEVVNVVEHSKDEYLKQFDMAFSNMDSIELYTYFNIQKYLPNEGFTQYHCERAGNTHSNRVLVWMIYLNTLTDFGQTEFYYQHHFERAIEGKILIWPSDWTYLHRGIPSPTQEKYILTGWYVHSK